MRSAVEVSDGEKGEMNTATVFSMRRLGNSTVAVIEPGDDCMCTSRDLVFKW